MRNILLAIFGLGIITGAVIWKISQENFTIKHGPPKMLRQPIKNVKHCKGCKINLYKYFVHKLTHRALVDNTVKLYSKTWRRNKQNYRDFRSSLHMQCNAFDNGIVTQTNSPVGTHITQSYVVKESLYEQLPKEHPFLNKTWDKCSVVGNGGILLDSCCGRKIDSADFVIRCNLPPLGKDFEDHVGTKSNLVTSNPTIFLKLRNHTALLKRFEPFGDSMILIPAFGYLSSLAFKTVRTLKQFNNPSRPVYFNPSYLSKLTQFWRSRGVKAKLSSGLIMVSMALEVCKEVHVYGFWPLPIHPFGLHFLPHHYYDDTLPKFHKMSVEFKYLLDLHTQGVIRLHLEVCEN